MPKPRVLSREQALRLAAITTELKRRKREERIRYFKPINPAMPSIWPPDDPVRFGPSNDQEGFIFDPAAERWALGGNRSCKTESVVADCIMFCTGTHPVRSLHRKPPVKVRFCGTSYRDTIKGVILPKFMELVRRCDLKGDSFETAWSEASSTLTFKNGSFVKFMSFEQHLNKFGGADLDAVYGDEGGPKAYYIENKARLTDRNGYYVHSMTPEEGLITWEHGHLRRFRDDPNVAVYRFSIYGNPHLSREGVLEFEKTITDPRLRDVKLFGKFVALAGMVYEQFGPHNIIPYRELPDSWPRVFGLDPHLKKASGMLWGAWSPDNEFIVYRAVKKFYTIPQLKQYIRAQSAGEHICLWVGDEAMGGDGKNIFGQTSVLAQLAEPPNEIPISPTNQSSDKAFKAGVFKIRDMLITDPKTNRPTIMVMDNCTELIDEFEEYQFIPNVKQDDLTFRERVRTVNDDLLSPLRYLVMAGPQQRIPEVKSAIGKDDW